MGALDSSNGSSDVLLTSISVISAPHYRLLRLCGEGGKYAQPREMTAQWGNSALP